MKLTEKLEIANRAIATLPPLIRANGVLSPATALAPGNWAMMRESWQLGLSDNVLLSPIDEAVSSLMDIWDPAGKVFSASWMPGRPWVPPRIVKCTAGDWQKLLDGWSA